MSNTIDTLRGHLFDTLAALRDPDNPMELDRAKAVAEVAQTIINTAKVEVEYARVTGTRTASTFLPAPEQPDPGKPALPTGTERTVQQIPGGRRITNVAR